MPKKPVDEWMRQDKHLLKARTEKKVTGKKYKVALQEIERLKAEQEAILQLQQTPQTIKFNKRKDVRTDATAFIIASDWHIEEPVERANVSGLNEFSLRIARQRIGKFFPSSLKLLEICQKESKITNVVLALLGDFISGSIHDELMEANQLAPADAIWRVQNHIIGGIEFLLEHSECNLTVVCHPGNHGRMTAKNRHATENGNSLESYMYHNLALYFRGNKRIRFTISEGYHTYVEVYGFTVRFHHGHDIRYAGGVGGIYIPTNKAIAQWNKGKRADLDVFGHFHQLRDGGNFICNGSLIGYNAYALSIKADYETPKQAFFLIDKKHGKSIVAPIWLA